MSNSTQGYCSTVEGTELISLNIDYLKNYICKYHGDIEVDIRSCTLKDSTVKYIEEFLSQITTEPVLETKHLTRYVESVDLTQGYCALTDDMGMVVGLTSQSIRSMYRYVIIHECTLTERSIEKIKESRNGTFHFLIQHAESYFTSRKS